VATYYVVNGSGKPIELKSLEAKREPGEEIEVPVYQKFWKTDRGSGVDLLELVDRKF